jgi:transketolase
MAEDPKVFFVTADVGYHLAEPIFENFPDRALNVGIAEQNLIGIAAGLCNAGFRPFVYSYTNFLAERAFEQLRDDICLHRYAPIIAGTTTGFDGSILGPTHFALDDMAGIRALPNMRVYSPGSNESMGLIIKEAHGINNEASFIRFTKSEFAEGKPIESINHFVAPNDAARTLVMSHGKMVQNCHKAAGIEPSFALFAMDRIKPLDGEIMKTLVRKYQRIVVAEDNFRTAGLFNAVAQWLAENKIRNVELISISPKEEYNERIGSTAYMEDLYGLSPEKIAAFITSL